MRDLERVRAEVEELEYFFKHLALDFVVYGQLGWLVWEIYHYALPSVPLDMYTLL